MTKQRRLKIFICYARSDQVKAYDLYKRLIGDGLDAWIDKESLLPGQDWELEIRKFIRKADVVVVCLSKKFNKTGFRQKEVRLALDVALEKPGGEIFIIPVRLEKCETLESLRRWNWVDLFEDDGYVNLMRALCQRAKEIGVTMPQFSTQVNFEAVRSDVTKQKRKNSSGQKRTLKNTPSGDILGAKEGNQSIVAEGNVIDSPLISGNKTETPDGSTSGSETKTKISLVSERFVPDRILKGWLNLHGLTGNPFGDVDLKSYPYYPEGATYPDRWDAFLDPVPLLAHCLTPDDAQALSYLLRKECLPLGKIGVETYTKRWVFPLWVSNQQTDLMQSPFFTLARSAAQTWMDILPLNLFKLDELPQVKQDSLMDLLRWAFGSANEIVSLLQANGLEDDVIGLSLIRKIEKYEKETTPPSVPQDITLLSWLKLRPPDYHFSYLILPLVDESSIPTYSLWLEQFKRFFDTLFMNGIVVKVISSTDLSSKTPFFVIRLNWSGNQLKLSLDSQFDHATDSATNHKGPKGRKVKFIELFGSGPFGYVETDERTTDKLISASRNSLARMLTLGNLLLQYHCENRKKDGVPEKYLYVDDLETILNAA